MVALSVSATARQPLASLDTQRIWPFLNSKMNLPNRQNGHAVALKSQISREGPENVDPTTLHASSKRKRALYEDDLKQNTSVKSPKNLPTTTTTGKQAAVTPCTPPVKPLSSSKSASFLKPAVPAGRSPRSKSCRAFGSHSAIVKTRPESANRHGVLRPFSIAKALANEIPKSPVSAKNAGWIFDIYVDSEQEEMTNLVQHSTCVLDISDHDRKGKDDARGKENIPPAALSISSSEVSQQVSDVPASRKNMMTEDVRTPLGELKASDYYGPDCNAFSIAAIPDEDSQEIEDCKPTPNTVPYNLEPSGTPELQNFDLAASILEVHTPADAEQASAPLSEAESDIRQSGIAAEEPVRLTEFTAEPELCTFTS